MTEEIQLPGDENNDDGGVNEPEEKTEDVPPQMTPVMMRSLLHMLLTSVKGITIPQQTFDEYDPSAKMNMTFDPVNKIWRFWIPQPKIITPGGNGHKRILISKTGKVTPLKRKFR